MSSNSHLGIRRHSDQFYCSHCKKTWDANDPDPPECVSTELLTVAIIGFLTAKLACYEPDSQTVKNGLKWLEENARS